MKNTINEKDGVFTLMRNGKAAVCPYRQPIVLPGQLQGQVQIMPHPCNSQCPHFGKETSYQYDYILKLTCGKGVSIFAEKHDKTDQPTEKPDQAKKIIL